MKAATYLEILIQISKSGQVSVLAKILPDPSGLQRISTEHTCYLHLFYQVRILKLIFVNVLFFVQGLFSALRTSLRINYDLETI